VGLYVARLLRSAVKGVEARLGHAPEKLFISKVTADKGPHLKRFRARAIAGTYGRVKPDCNDTPHECE